MASSSASPSDARQLSAALADTVLGGREVEVVGPSVLAVRCSADEVWPAWQAARSVVDVTLRWPVVVTSWDKEDPWDLSVGLPPGGLAGVAESASGVDPWATLGRDVDEPLDGEDLEFALADLPDSVTLTVEDVRELIGPDATAGQIEELAFDRLPADAPWGQDLKALDWYEPTDQACAVVFLDTPLTWVAGGCVSYFEMEGPDLVAAQKQWSEKYGAELVAAWGTMLQFVATRPPTDPRDAWLLAGQQLAVGPDLMMSGVTRFDLAFALVGRERWFLHNRP